jgi:hypothetical protein
MTSAFVVTVPGRRVHRVFELPQPGGRVYVGVTDVGSGDRSSPADSRPFSGRRWGGDKELSRLS